MFVENKLTIAIQLTRFYFKRPDGQREKETKIWVFVDHIVTMQHVDAGLESYTEIITDAGSLLVQETIDEIYELITKEK